MRYVTRAMAVPIRRDLAAGGAAGLVGGLVFWWALRTGHDIGRSRIAGTANFRTRRSPAPAGLYPSGRRIRSGFTLSAFRVRGHHELRTITGPPVVDRWPHLFRAAVRRHRPDVVDRGSPNGFPQSHRPLLYGGLTGLGFYILVASYLRLWPQPEDLTTAPEAPKTRV